MNRAALFLMAALALGVASAQTAPAQAAEPVPAQPAEPSVATPQRESTVRIPLDAPAEAISLVIGQALPEGATYLAGSSTLNGAALPDPLRSPSGRLYWPVAAVQRGLLTYRVAHTAALGRLPQPALYALYPRDRGEVLAGQFSLKDYAAATPAEAPAAPENAGPIKLPAAGTVYRDRDRIAVTVEGPLDVALAPTLNGEVLPVGSVGKRVIDQDNNRQRLEYLGARLKPGENVIALGTETVRVYYAGPTARVDVTPLQLRADGSTPLRLRLRALDAGGLTTAQPFLTVRSSIEPSTPDANPQDAGYQLRLTDGEAELTLPPQTTPVTLTLDLDLGGRFERRTFEVTPDQNGVAIGALSATLGFGNFNSGLDFRLSARGYLEGFVGRGKLYAAADKDGLPVSANPNTRYPLYGDASSEEQPLQGLDPVAFRYEHPDFSVQYRQAAVPLSVLPYGERLTALSASTTGDTRLSGFVALVPGDRVSGELVALNGTRVVRLSRGNVLPDSETLELVTLARDTGAELRRQTLVRYADYSLDTDTGVITLSRALENVDADLNAQQLRASYRVATPGDGRYTDPFKNNRLAYGAQVERRGQANDQSYSFGVGAASIDGVLTAGASAQWQNAATKLSGRALYATGGVQLSADASHTAGDAQFGLGLRYQSADYAGLGQVEDGLRLTASYGQKLGARLNLGVSAEYHNLPGAATPGAPGVAGSVGGEVTARADYRLEPFTVGGGLRANFGDTSGLSAVGAVGYHAAPIDIDVTHAQPLSGNVGPTTQFSARYALSSQVALTLKDDIDWRSGQRAAVGLESRLGGTNLGLAYELPNADGSGNRARFGVDTSLPLSDQFNLGLRASLLRGLADGASDFSAGSDLRFKTERVSASLGGDVSFSSAGWREVLRGGATGSFSDTFSLTADGLAEFGAQNGSRFALGYAWRGGDWNSLGSLRYQVGSLSGGRPELLGLFSAEYHRTAYALRAGLDARSLLDDPSSFTFQPSLGGTLYLSRVVGVGAWGRALIQPATGTATYGLGVEGSLRALPGTWITLGYNFLGFDGLGSGYTKPGLYLRLDLTLDETVGEKK